MIIWKLFNNSFSMIVIGIGFMSSWADYPAAEWWDEVSSM